MDGRPLLDTRPRPVQVRNGSTALRSIWPLSGRSRLQPAHYLPFVSDRYREGYALIVSAP